MRVGSGCRLTIPKMYPPPTKRADSVCKNVDPGSEHSNLASSRYEIGFIKTYNRLGSLLLAESHSQKQSLSLKLKLKGEGSGLIYQHI